MAKREKIAITVDDALLAQVERMRKKLGESRSAVFERALSQYLTGIDREAESQRYMDAYRRQPETAAECKETMSLAVAAFETEEWDAPR
jgi:metal-responsive CopG/Arc/MetJ family transcriptional regulator